MNAEDVEIIVDALNNIAHYSLYMFECNDVVSGELTRVINAYSNSIKQDDNKRNKEAYKKAMSVLKKSQIAEKHLIQLKDRIQSFLEYLSAE